MNTSEFLAKLQEMNKNNEISKRIKLEEPQQAQPSTFESLLSAFQKSQETEQENLFKAFLQGQTGQVKTEPPHIENSNGLLKIDDSKNDNSVHQPTGKRKFSESENSFASLLQIDNDDSNLPSLLRTNLDTFKTEKVHLETVDGSIKKGTIDPLTHFDEEFDVHIKRFDASNRCGDKNCSIAHKEHYHCIEPACGFPRFTNKNDVIRHYNMHKKKENAFKNGFRRFAPSEDCTRETNPKQPCHYNGKSTHYHCIECEKVYTSTSDVMTHANFHKKNKKFITDGFQRFRASEDCGMEACQFREQHTTHFHCSRKDCNHVFKNKAEIEKHKQYHIRDEAFMSQGFKKYYRNDDCSTQECPWKMKSNHFHCLRCGFAFTNTNQMLSHKRKHMKMDAQGMKFDLNPEKGPSQILEVENKNFVVFDKDAVEAGECTCFLKPLSHFHCKIENCGAVFPESEKELLKSHEKYHKNEKAGSNVSPRVSKEEDPEDGENYFDKLQKILLQNSFEE